MPQTHRAMVKVVIVDDSASPRAVLRSVLDTGGYDVVAELADASSLEASIARLGPHIVCLGSDLPERNGLDVLGEIRDKHPQVAVVMITAGDDIPERTAAVEAGAAGFLHVPFSPAQVLEELRQVAHAQSLLGALPPAAGPVGGKSRPRAVVADDSPAARRLLSAILREAGFEVVAEAGDAGGAVDVVRQHRPELTCLDLEMPGVGGLDALEKIRAFAPELRIVVVTNHASKDNVQAAAARGARGYILKPLHPEKVIAAVRTAFLR